MDELTHYMDAVSRLRAELQSIAAHATALEGIVNRYARHDELCHKLDRESLATYERVCTCGLEDALSAAG